MNNTNYKIEKVTMSSVIVGVDIAKYKHKARVFDYRGIELSKKTIVFNNDQEGFEYLSKEINRVCLINGKNHVMVGLEPTGHYWFNLAHYIERLDVPIKHEVVTVNPAHTKKANELDDNSQTKDDKKDAKTIGRLVCEGRYSIVNIPKGIYANLRNYDSYRERLIKTQNSLINRIKRGMDIMFPEYCKLFRNITRIASMQTLMNFPSPKEILSLTDEEILKKWREASKLGFSINKVKTLKSLATSSVGVSEGVNALNFEIRSLAKQLQLIKLEEENLNKLIEDEINKIEYVEKFVDIKGLALASVSGIVSEVGDFRNYKSSKQIVKLAGYNLRENSSGTYSSKTSISKRGRRRLRLALYKAIMPLITQNAAFRELYDYYRNRQKNPLTYKQAVVALSCKLLRVLHGISKNNMAFRPEEVLRGIKYNNETNIAA